MVVHELLLDCSVEPLAMGVHLWCLGVGVVMREMQCREPFREVLLELRSVVREDMLEGHGKDHAAEPEELFRSLRGVGGRAPREPEPAVEILEGDDVPPAAVDEAFHGIQSDAMTGVGGLEVLGLAQDLPSVDLLRSSEVIDLLREDPQSSHVSDEPPHRGSGGNGQIVPSTETCEEDLQLLLPKVRMFHAQPLDLLQDWERPCTDAAMHRGPGTFIQGGALPMTFPQLFLPEEQRPPLHLECIHRGLKTMLLPEDQNLVLSLGFVSKHTVPPYRPVVAGDEVKAFECGLEASSSHGSGDP